MLELEQLAESTILFSDLNREKRLCELGQIVVEPRSSAPWPGFWSARGARSRKALCVISRDQTPRSRRMGVPNGDALSSIEMSCLFSLPGSSDPQARRRRDHASRADWIITVAAGALVLQRRFFPEWFHHAYPYASGSKFFRHRVERCALPSASFLPPVSDAHEVWRVRGSRAAQTGWVFHSRRRSVEFETVKRL